MASRTLNVTEEAYEALKARKREGESFTDVILRLTGQRSFEELFGMFTPAQAEEFRRAAKGGRARSRRRRERQVRRLAKR